MAATNSINSFSNLTHLSLYQTEPALFFLFPSTSKNYSNPKLDFTMTDPYDTRRKSTAIFNQKIPSKDNALGDAENQAIFGPLLLNGSEFIADFSGQIRQVFSSYHELYGTENPAALAALGVTSGLNLFTGGLNVKSAIEEIKTAEKTSDVVGKVLGHLKIARGAAQATGGAAIIPARVLSIAALMTSLKVISTIAGVLGSFASACFNGVSLLAAIGTGIRLHELRLFRNELNAILKDPQLTEAERPVKALEHLKKLATVSSLEKEEIRKEIEALPEFGTFSPQQITEKVEEKANLLLLKKEAILKRLLDEDCLTQIRQKGPSEANSVIETVLERSKEKVILASITMGLLIVGIAIMIAAFIVTGPMDILVMTALSLAISFGWLLLDGYELFKEFKSTDAGRFDKLCIFISSVIAVISVAVVFFLSGSIGPIIAAAVVGAVWLVINAMCYSRLYANTETTSKIGQGAGLKAAEN